MANIKSAKKRVLVTETKTARNKAIRSKVKTMIKKVEAAIAAGDKAAAQASLVVAISEIDKAASKGVYHKNTASRKVARLTKAVNGIASIEFDPIYKILSEWCADRIFCVILNIASVNRGQHGLLHTDIHFQRPQGPADSH